VKPKRRRRRRRRKAKSMKYQRENRKSYQSMAISINEIMQCLACSSANEKPASYLSMQCNESSAVSNLSI
jgi:hypothetical protein